MALRVLVTGAAGQIGYSLIQMIARGDMFGPNQKIILHLLEITAMQTSLGGLVMELEDCCFPLLEEVIVTDKEEVAFNNIDAACLVGSMPRREGMERKDLLKANGKIFESQGSALDKYAKKSVKVVVVGNPANTNCYVLAKNAPSIPKKNFSALTRLDHNRAIGQIAIKCNVSCDDVKNVIIWGNHSSTQFADVSHGCVKLPSGKTSIYDAVKDESWIRNDFLKLIQTRGAAVISARKLSSAMSAAKAIVDHMHTWWFGTKEGEFVSMAVMSNGEYGAPDGVIFSFPVEIKDKDWTIKLGLSLDDWAKEKLMITGNELVEEKNTFASL